MRACFGVPEDRALGLPIFSGFAYNQGRYVGPRGRVPDRSGIQNFSDTLSKIRYKHYAKLGRRGRLVQCRDCEN